MLDSVVTQARFGELVGVTQQAVSDMVARGILQPSESLRSWLLAYCDHLREQAAGRASSTEGGLDLVQERAALAREQRIRIELQNNLTRGEYAPIGALTDVLAMASQGIADRLEAVASSLKKTCPELSPSALDHVQDLLTKARNEWVRATISLVAGKDVTPDDDDEPQEDVEGLEGPAAA
jgi:phage terminase Nu1 subunit (DNA packaging protein)